MYIALHLPDLPLRAAVLAQPGLWDQPLALTHDHAGRNQKSILASVNPAARAHGLHEGISSARALARCPRLQILRADPGAEDFLQSELLQLAQSLAPDLEATTPDTLILMDRGSVTMRKALSLGSPPIPVISESAATPDLAHLLTRLTSNGGEDVRKMPLPILLQTFLPRLSSHPGEAADLARTCHLWGLETIGDFTDLPRPDLHERLGPAAALLHDIATGRHHRLLTLHRPPKDYRLHHDLDFGIETLDQLLLLLRNLLLTLTARLRSHQRVPAALHLDLKFDDASSHRSDLRIPEPTTELEPLLRILHTHLETLTAPAPLTALSLDATPALPGRAQSDLFQRSLRDPNQFAHTLNQLAALLGPEDLGIPVPKDTHRPDQFAVLPAETLFSPDFKARKPPPGTGLPLRRLRPPLEIKVLATPHHEPQALLNSPYPGPLEAVAGPYRLNGDWWQADARWQTEEWDVLLHTGPLARLSRTPPHLWQLEGYY